MHMYPTIPRDNQRISSKLLANNTVPFADSKQVATTIAAYGFTNKLIDSANCQQLISFFFFNPWSENSIVE